MSEQLKPGDLVYVSDISEEQARLSKGGLGKAVKLAGILSKKDYEYRYLIYIQQHTYEGFRYAVKAEDV